MGVESVYVINVRAQDNGGKSPKLSSDPDLAVIIKVTDFNDSPPLFTTFVSGFVVIRLLVV